MLDDDARRALEQEAIALVNLSSGKPTRAQPNQQPTDESVAQPPPPPIHALLQQHKATLMARRDDSSAPHPHRVKQSSPLRERERACLSMSVYVNGADGKMSVVPAGKTSPDHHAAFEMTRPDHSVDKRHAQDGNGEIPVKQEGPITSGFGHETPSPANELQRISMQSLLVTLKKRKAEDDGQTNTQQSVSATKLPRFRDVFEPPRLPETQPVQTAPMHAPPVQFSAPQMMPAPPSPSNTAPVLEEPSPYPPPPELKCKYRTGKCNNVRALKSCGDYHNLCNYHRLRANANQRKLDRKKKEQRQQYPSSSTSSPTKVSSPAATQSVPPAAAAAAALAAMPTSFIPPHQHHRASGSSAAPTPFLPYMVPPMAPGSSKSSLRPKSAPNAC